MSYISHISLRGAVSANNSTSIPLGGGGVFTGSADDIVNQVAIIISVTSDVTSAVDGLSIQFSIDGISWAETDAYTIAPNSFKTFTVQPIARYFRVVYTNGVGAQTTFWLSTQFRQVPVKSSSHRVGDNITGQDDAELIKAVLSAETPGGVYTNINCTAGSNLKISLEEIDSSVLGQELMADSVPVVIASNQSAVPVSGSLTISSGSITADQGTAAAQTSATAWPIRLVGGTGDRAATIDSSTNALNIIDYDHHEIHDGSSFSCHYNNDCTNVGEMTIIAFNTPNTTEWMHIVFEAESTAAAYMAIYEDADLDVDEGSALTIWNRNRNSAHTSVVTSIETVPVANRATSYNETQAAGATLDTTNEVDRHYMGAGVAGADVPGSSRGVSEYVLKQNTQYAFVIVSTTNDDNTHNIRLSWYEHTNKTS